MNIKSLVLAAAIVSLGAGMAWAADEGNKGFIYLNNKVCPISGEEVGKMGPAVEVEYKGTKVNLCCKMCKKDFEKDPEGYIKKLQEEKAEGGMDADGDMDGHQH